MTGTYDLAVLLQQTINRWHDVASSDSTKVSPLLAQDVVFRSPCVQTPFPGHAATLLVLGTVGQIFETCRYHRTFVGGPHASNSNSSPMSANGS